MNRGTRSNNKGGQGGIANNDLPFWSQLLSPAVQIGAFGDP